VLCQRVYRVREAFSIRPGSFYPAPQVTSTVVALEPRGQEDSPQVWALFRSLVQAAFRSRRKTLWNNLQAWSSGLGEERLAASLAAEGIAPNCRAEQLGPERLAALARRLASEDL
jgi:16S rRNA (adenine1518-N6/adenine1519-N6)-dimethyltransferase